MDEPENSMLRERKPVTKGHIVHDSMFKTGTSIDRVNQVLPRAGGGRVWGGWLRGVGFLLG